MCSDPKSIALGLLRNATPVLFFTGPPGVGKTGLAAACAMALADAGRRVLLIGDAKGRQAAQVAQTSGLQVMVCSGPAAIAEQLGQEPGDVDHRLFDVELGALLRAWRTQPEALPSLHRHDGLLALADPWRTTVVLVTRPDPASLQATAQLHERLAALDVGRQWLLVNGWPQTLGALPAALQSLPRDVLPSPEGSPTRAPP